MKWLVNIVKRYQSFIAYAIFGMFTTIVNIVCYNFFYYGEILNNVLSNAIAWVFAVAFAYITNKLWVFESKSWKLEVIGREISAFISCRLLTGLLDLIIMYITVDIMRWSAFLMKIISNVLVIILNYVFSKLIIFKK